MSRNYKFHNPGGIYFISFATVFWVDVFVRKLSFQSHTFATKLERLIISMFHSVRGVPRAKMERFGCGSLHSRIDQHPQACNK